MTTVSASANIGRLRRLLCLIVLALLCSACSQPSIPTLNPGDNILAFGDSLTAGVGATEGHDYPAVLSRLSGLEVVNAGISGETTAEGIQRFGDEIIAHQPELIILLEGGNDILRNYDLRQTKSNLAQMLSVAKGANIPVILISVPQKSLFLASAPLYQELADEYGVLLLDDAISELFRQPNLKADRIHFNDAGYQKLAEVIYSQL